jgi:F-type H+-transporting ATPase subunit delta
MSELTTAARPYANAVYKLATEANAQHSWSNALALLAQVSAHAEVARLLAKPLSKQDKTVLMIKLVGDKLDAEQQNLVKLMAENNRLGLLATVAELFEAYCAKAAGHIDAQIISAFPLSDAQQTMIGDALKKKTGRKVTITSAVDAALIGGVVIKAGDTIIDGSMKSRLAKLASTLSR